MRVALFAGNGWNVAIPSIGLCLKRLSQPVIFSTAKYAASFEPAPNCVPSTGYCSSHHSGAGNRVLGKLNINRSQTILPTMPTRIVSLSPASLGATLHGVSTLGNVWQFRNLQYASIPYRFANPELPPALSGDVDCTIFGYVCTSL